MPFAECLPADMMESLEVDIFRNDPRYLRDAFPKLGGLPVLVHRNEAQMPHRKSHLLISGNCSDDRQPGVLLDFLISKGLLLLLWRLLLHFV